MQPSPKSGRLALICAVAAALAVPAVATRAQTNGAPVRFTANAVNMSGVGPTGSGTVQIEVSRWSTDAERDKLLNALWDKGPDKLLDVLRDMPKVGYIRTPTSLGWDLHYARQTPMPDGGNRVILATDRPIGFREAANQPRSIEYPFTVIEIHMNRDGEGEGKMSIATRIEGNKDEKIITLENYATQPVMLTTVREERASR
jgi:hypothetical protein